MSSKRPPEITFSPEEIGSTGRVERPWTYRHSRALVRTALATIVISTGVGGYLGYKHGEKGAQTAHAHHVAEMARYQRCLQIVRKNSEPNSQTAIVYLASLTEQEQQDCGISGLSDTIEESLPPIMLPLDAKLVRTNFNPEIQLPTKDKLEDTILREAAEVSKDRSFDKTKDAVIGGFLGFVAAIGSIGLIASRKEIKKSLKALAEG